jgi:protein-serine/threonine kinase
MLWLLNLLLLIHKYYILPRHHFFPQTMWLFGAKLSPEAESRRTQLKRAASRIFKSPTKKKAKMSTSTTSGDEPQSNSPLLGKFRLLRFPDRRPANIDGAHDISPPSSSEHDATPETPLSKGAAGTVRSSSAPSSASPISPTWSAVASSLSTAATSWASPPSSQNKRTTPEDCVKESNGCNGHDDGKILTPIDENTGHDFLIPVQSAELIQEPSVVTVENTSAAKVYLETYYNAVFNQDDPRALRRKRLEIRIASQSEEEREAARQQWFREQSEHLRQLRVLKSTSLMRHNTKGISIAGFDVVRVLGKGSFGVVKLVTERSRESQNDTETLDGTATRNLPAGKPLSNVFAMKVIRKSKMLRSCQEGHLRAERDFLVNAEHSRWVVPLIASLQDNTNLFLIMEYMIGGDFLGLLLREDVLDEDVAR